MSNPRLAMCGLLLFVVAGVGCAPKATFDVTIVNHAGAPVTVGIVKEGEPYEEHLGGPERWAIDSPLESLRPWGHVIPPGRTMDSGPITGAFPRGALAYLRVYRGERDNATLIAISNPSPDRAEVLLFPGRSEWMVVDENGNLKVKRIRRPGAATTAPAASGQ